MKSNTLFQNFYKNQCVLMNEKQYRSKFILFIISIFQTQLFAFQSLNHLHHYKSYGIGSITFWFKPRLIDRSQTRQSFE